jgi:hypothetical protein
LFQYDVPFTVAVVLQITPSISYWCCGSINIGHCVGSHLRIKCAVAQILSRVHPSFKCCSDGIGTYVIQLSNIFLDPVVVDLNTTLQTWNSDLINPSREILHCHVKRWGGIMM